MKEEKLEDVGEDVSFWLGDLEVAGGDDFSEGGFSFSLFFVGFILPDFFFGFRAVAVIVPLRERFFLFLSVCT